jgi:hypothetical protein
VPKAQSPEHCNSLGGCCHRSSSRLFPSTYREPDRRVKHASGENQVCVIGCGDYRHGFDRLVSLGFITHSSGAAAADIALGIEHRKGQQ